MAARIRWSEEEPVALLAHHYRHAWELSRSRTGPTRSSEPGQQAQVYLRKLADETFTYQARAAEVSYGRALVIADELGDAADETERVRALVGHAEALADLGRSREIARTRHPGDRRGPAGR